MKIGDTVRFLNATGGGIVKGFQGKDIVIVEDDGFDTPILIRECILIQPANQAQVRDAVKPTQQVMQASKASDRVQTKRPVDETKGGDSISVLLAYLPIDIKNISTTGYECYLINDSNYYLSFNYMSRSEAGWKSRSTGIIEPNTQLFLEEFEKADLNEMEKVCLQFISYKEDKLFSIKNPCSVELRIDTVKFYKLHSFRENDYFEDDAIMYQVMKKDLPEKAFTVSAEDLERGMMEKKQSDRPRVQSIVRKTENEILEIDLHIHELLDNVSGMSSADMLNYQLTKFREILNENKNNKGRKIVFIHGKGDGVLKTGILNELKTKYKNVYFQDASFREYGFGATMVTIK